MSADLDALLGECRRHVDVRDIPSLVPARYVNATAQAVNAELIGRIKRLQDMVNSGNIEIDASSSGIFPRIFILYTVSNLLLRGSDDAPKTTCPFIIFGQLIPTSVPKDLMQELESEMENPTGITTVTRPELLMNAILMSRECGIMLEMRSAEGLKSQRFWRKVTTCKADLNFNPSWEIGVFFVVAELDVGLDSAVAAGAYLVLLLLFIRQTDVSQTPAGISRVSRWTFLTQSAADSISFVGVSSVVLLSPTWLTFFSPSAYNFRNLGGWSTLAFSHRTGLSSGSTISL